MIKNLVGGKDKPSKVVKIATNKFVNFYHIWAFDTYEQYCSHYRFAEYHAKEDMLTREEWELFKKLYP